MQIYKELETLGFFKWYCTQYGGLVYQEYKPVYDDLPLDNLIRTKLNACVFKFFREKYNILLDVVMFYDENQLPLTYKNLQKPKGYFVWDYYDEDFSEDKAIKFYTHEEAELECLKKLILIVKK